MHPLAMCAMLVGVSGVVSQGGDFVGTANLVQVHLTTAPRPALRAPQVPAQLGMLEPTITPVAAAVEGRPWEIGYVRPAPPNVMPGNWLGLADGSHVLRVELLSEQAVGLRVRLRDAFPNQRLELRIYNPTTNHVLGPYRAARRGQDGTWWSPTIFGSMIGLEFYLPPGAPVPKRAPQVLDVAHLYCAEQGPCDGIGPDSFAAPLDCHIDIMCHPEWAVEASAVALLYFVSGGGCHTCTGALLNRGPQDFSPMFMTAHHCISTQSVADSLEVRWFYESLYCNGPPKDFDTLPVTLGGLLLKRHPDSDWTLLGLFEPPPAGVYLGWSSGSWDSGDAATGIHHPRSRHKRICFGESDGSTDSAVFERDDGTTFEVDVWDVAFSDGATEGGSSGSPIFDSVRRVRGTLTGGPRECPDVTKYYGRFDLAYENLKYYLGSDHIASPVFVHYGIAGDPGNNGVAERGTDALPFNTVFEGTYAVRSGDSVWIAPGNYNERMRIWRPMWLVRWGATGTVRIGE